MGEFVSVRVVVCEGVTVCVQMHVFTFEMMQAPPVEAARI